MDRGLFIAGGLRRRRRRSGPAEWGTPMPLLHESITNIHEKDLVNRVLNSMQYRDTLLNIQGLNSQDARILEQVELRNFRKSLDGEIDILVIPAGHPEQTTAIQVKRFKAKVRMNENGFDDADTGHPSRLQETFDKGVRQANKTKAVGFSQVYLWVFIVIDTRARNGGHYTYEGPDSLLRSRINSVVSTAGLEPGVGLMEFDWVQPMDRPPLGEPSTSGGHLVKLAEPGIQPAELTDWLAALPPQVLHP